MHDDDLLIRLGELGANSKRQSDTHGAERSGIETMAGHKGWHRLAAEVQDLLPVDHQDGVALHEILDFVAQSQRMDRQLVHRLVDAGASRLATSPSDSVRRQAANWSALVRLALASMSCRSTALQSPTMPISILRGAVAISSASMSMRTILAAALKRGGAAWPMI